jgi:hypothetical protein
MNRSIRVSVCVVAMLLASMRSKTQQGLGTIQNLEGAYPDSSEGLQKLLQDTIEAVTAKDAAKEEALIRTLIMPEDSSWFKDEFGPAFGPRLAAAYQRTRPALEQELQTVYEGNAQRGWSRPKIFRYADAATADSPIDKFLNCMDVTVPLYGTAFNGDRTVSYFAPGSKRPGLKVAAGDIPGYYVYAKGGFRFVPQGIFFLLPKERPIRIQLDMNVMQSKMVDHVGGLISPETFKELADLHTKGKVVIHFVLDTDGKIKEANAVEGPPNLSDVFLRLVKQWTFEPTTLDGEPVEVEVNFETGFQINGKS